MTPPESGQEIKKVFQRAVVTVGILSIEAIKILLVALIVGITLVGLLLIEIGVFEVVKISLGELLSKPEFSNHYNNLRFGIGMLTVVIYVIHTIFGIIPYIALEWRALINKQGRNDDEYES